MAHTAEMTAMPCAPARMTDAAVCNVIPPIAITGHFAISLMRLSRSNPLGSSASVLDVVWKIGPKPI